MDFFDKLGKKASEAYKVTADKTGKLAKEAKLRLKMSELKSQIDDIYQEIGKKVYESHIREEELDLASILEEECTKIDVLSDEIEADLQECLDLKGKKQCSNCYKEIDQTMRFCPECGAKQQEAPAREVEILEKLENVDISPDKKQEADDVRQNLQEELNQDDRQENEEIQENSENVQVSENENDRNEDNDGQITVEEVSSQDETEKEQETVRSNREELANEEKTPLARTVQIESDIRIKENREEIEEEKQQEDD